jgi:predicted dithiol-disulfide oxidoreductase (DUF899 family)
MKGLLRGCWEVISALAIKCDGKEATYNLSMAQMLIHNTTFPNETPAYRQKRDELLRAEMELRKQIDSVAALRRALPLGGEVPEDYEFTEIRDGAERKVRLSELFGPGRNTLVVYSFMLGPEQEKPCASCTSIVDALNGELPHIQDQVNMVFVGRSPIDRLAELVKRRDWKNVRMISAAGNTYSRDYQGEDEDGDSRPALNVFTKRDGKIYHTYCSELMFAPHEAGMDPRHVDMMWPLWNVLDYTPEGRGDWYPKLGYPQM